MAKRINTKNVKSESGNAGIQIFSIEAPGAQNVQLAGDFTHWQQEPVTMQKDADGVWHATVELQPGSYHYRFLVDGQWRDDPECALRVPNPFGGQDSVREVAESGPMTQRGVAAAKGRPREVSVHMNR